MQRNGARRNARPGIRSGIFRVGFTGIKRPSSLIWFFILITIDKINQINWGDIMPKEKEVGTTKCDDNYPYSKTTTSDDSGLEPVVDTNPDGTVITTVSVPKENDEN